MRIAVVVAVLVFASACPLPEAAAEGEGEGEGEGEEEPCVFEPGLDDPRYDAVLDLEGQDLIDGLRGIVAPHTGLGFDAARDRMFVTAEIDVDSEGMVECIYTGTRVPADETRSPGSGPLEITTEHTWPRSDGADVFPAEGDLHHLAPATSESNNERASLEFGEVSCDDDTCPFSSGGSLRGASTVSGAQVFEVRQEHRGDVARAHFYFSVRYSIAIGADEEAVLRRWHCEDPPSERERARNDAVEVHQDNRSPFVDRPELVERIADF